MPDATKNGNEASREERINDAPFSFLDDPISEMISEGDHDDPAGGGPGAGSESGDKDKGDKDVSPAVQAQLDRMAEQLEEQRQTTQYLRGENRVLSDQLRGGDKKEDKVEKPLLSIDKEKIKAALADGDTAADTLFGMFEDFGKNILERVNKVQEESRGEHSRRDAHSRWQAAVNDDLQNVRSEIGDLADDATFQKEVDPVLFDRISKRTGKSKEALMLTDVQPGDATYAAMVVYNRWLRSGKVSIDGKFTNNGESRNGNGNGNGNGDRRPTLREISRQVDSSDRSMSGGGPRGGGNGGAKSIADLGMSPRDTRIAQAAAKRMGVPEERWVANYNAGQAEDEGYGR